MKLLQIVFMADVHHRRSTCGGEDSEYSHTTVEKHIVNYVIGSDREVHVTRGLALCDERAAYDQSYRRISHSIGDDVHAVLNEPTRRLD